MNEAPKLSMDDYSQQEREIWKHYFDECDRLTNERFETVSRLEKQIEDEDRKYAVAKLILKSQVQKKIDSLKKR